MALVFGAGSVALGANGGNFILGQNNVASALTKLTGNVDGAAMQVQSNNLGADDTALSLAVQPGEAPLRVDSDARVANLNADKIDGKDSTQFLPTRTYGKQGTRFTSQVGGGTIATCDQGDVLLTYGYVFSSGFDSRNLFSAETSSFGVTLTFRGPTDVTPLLTCLDRPPLR